MRNEAFVPATMFQRLYRRIILKHFGSTKSFVVWGLAVIFTIYVIDTFILTRSRLEVMVHGQENEIMRMEQSLKDQKSKLEAANNKVPVVDSKPEAPAPKEGNGEVVQAVKQEEEKPSGMCGLKSVCPQDQVPYYLKSGIGKDGHPTICWNGQYVISAEKKNAQRGINMVVVDDKTRKVLEVRNFDTYTEDGVLLRYMKLGLKGSEIVLLASMDEITNNLGTESKSWLHNFGAGRGLDTLRFRDGYLMIGQRGLAQGSAVEKTSPREAKEFPEAVELTGCLPIPVGRLSVVKAPNPGPVNAGEPAKGVGDPSLKQGQEAPDCGVKQSCGLEAFPVHIYSGLGNTEGPKICVSGKYVLATGLNDGGRGLNIVIADPKTKDVIRVGHFDTYSEDSSNLEIFLEMLNEGDIILAVTHDDASKRLSDHAKKLLNELGSGLIQNMQFRDNWALVGQKGIDGFGYVEQLETRDSAASWPLSIDRRLCVPTKIKGSKIKPDPMANKNEARRKFCSKYDGYGEFCLAEHIDEALTPAPLTDKALEGHPIFQVPIIVIPGLNHNAVRMQLETLLLNPGIQSDMITIMFDEKFSEPAALADLFKFKSQKLTSSTKYVVQVQKALQKVWQIYPEANYVIVLEEEVIVSTDLLYFLSQCLPALQQDPTLLGVSGWNVNGYVETSGLTDTVYRVQMFPGLGFMLKKSVYDAHMAAKESTCCMQRSWHGWEIDHLNGEMLVPDVSRVYRRPYEGLSEEADLLTELFNRDRLTNIDSKAHLSVADKLTSDAYTKHVTSMLLQSSALDTANVGDCLAGKGLGFYVPETTGKSFSVYFEQSGITDYDILSRLCKCFRLFHKSGYRPRGLHRGVLRFTYKKNHMLFVGSKSPYFTSMPKNYKPVLRSQL